jgi:hypothetical protein
LAKGLRYDKRRFSWYSPNVIGMMPRMISVYSRQPLQESARCRDWSAFQAAALSRIYGIWPAYTAIMPSTLFVRFLIREMT